MIFTPEIFLALGVLLLLAISPFLKRNGHVIATYSSLIFVVIAQYLVFKDIFHFEEIYNGFFVIDSFGSFIKSLLLIGTGIILYIYLINNKDSEINKFEFPILILLAVIGMMLMVSSNDILSLFVAMELQSLSLYILVAFSRNKKTLVKRE